MATPKQKPQGLPNPYAQGGLPNPYALPTADAGASGDMAEEPAKLEENKKSTANLLFQPQRIVRPQAKTKPAIRKPVAPRAQTAANQLSSDQTSDSQGGSTQAVASSSEAGAAPAAPRASAVSQNNLENWKSTEEDDAYWASLRTERNREEKQQKKLKKMFGYWDGFVPYELSKPTNLNAYAASGLYQDMIDAYIGQLRNIQKGAAPQTSTDAPSEASEAQPVDSPSPPAAHNPKFAPPSFDEPALSPPEEPAVAVAPAAPVAPIPQTADEAYEHRLRLSQQRARPAAETQESTPVKSESPAAAPNRMVAPPGFDQPAKSLTPPNPTVVQSSDVAEEQRRKIAEQVEKAKQKAKELIAKQAAAKQAVPPPPPVEPVKTPDTAPPPPPPAPYNPTISAPPVRYSATISAPPVHYSPTISGAPVHYARPPTDQKSADEPQERPAKKQKTKEPPKPTKAALMMAKMGYVKGQGLGKNNDGVTTHLEVKMRKDQGGRPQARDDFDEDSGGRAIKSQQVFDITGGLKATSDKDYGPFGEPSRVLVTWGCIDGVDLERDSERDDGGIRQEMGDAFNAKFGPVTRIHVDLSSAARPVYIQFQDPLCALNAVNRFHEGYEFRGKKIKALFYDETKFNNFVYEH